ncbi:hypothetical protein pdam_00014713 [Pocillopora damicornis]|uniref:Uncharacterized protein n=1 Tax=Pocillopora damicornis TaxID=46731 RepID=A0A3M6U3V7_POCDA|nr:hypothetical protein pdam_00014713 [Pocillopora damicornis]
MRPHYHQDVAYGTCIIKLEGDGLEHVGAEKDWCKEVRKRLQESKLYLKTKYRNHCKDDESKCADHCMFFALSDAGDTDFQRACSHSPCDCILSFFMLHTAYEVRGL